MRITSTLRRTVARKPSMGGLMFAQEWLDILEFDKNSTYNVSFGGVSPPNPPRGDGTDVTWKSWGNVFCSLKFTCMEWCCRLSHKRIVHSKFHARSNRFIDRLFSVVGRPAVQMYPGPSNWVYFFGHRSNCLWNDRLNQLGHNVGPHTPNR